MKSVLLSSKFFVFHFILLDSVFYDLLQIYHQVSNEMK